MKNKGGSKMSKDQLIERLQKIRHELDVISENSFSGFTLYCMVPILTELDTIITKLSGDKLNVKSEDEIEMTDEACKRMLEIEAKYNLIEKKISDLNDKVVEALQKLQKMKNERLIRQLRGIGNHLNNIGETAIKGDPQTKFLVILDQSVEATKEINNIILEIENE